LIQTWDTARDVSVRAANFSELYNRQSDAAEARNVYASPDSRQVVERLEREIQRHIARHLRTAATAR
jgi:hypothetical protein